MATVRLEPWAEGDFDLLRRQNTPAMTEHLGGPETDEKLADRQRRYVDSGGDGQMFRAVALPDGDVVGSTGYWERTWRGEPVYETGYAVLPEFQGRGLAVAVLLELISVADRKRRWLHAFPKVRHAASNAVCRNAGFELVGECEFEYPKGHLIRSNDWRIDRGPDSAHGRPRG